MTKTRLEAFSDGVLAIIITIMVLELKIPHEADWAALEKLFPAFCSYLLSFIFVGIYWANHHHLLHTIKRVNSRIIWSNMGLLFTLSLVPFTTGWMGENHYASIPVAVYTINLFVCGFAAFLFQLAIIRKLPREDKVFLIIKRNLRKNYFSVLSYIVAIAIAFYYPYVSLAIIVLVAMVWVIPNQEIERMEAEVE